MPFSKTIVKFDAPIFDNAKRVQLTSNTLTRSAKRFKEKTRVNMVQGTPTGHIYSKRQSGVGFTRHHRASAWGQRPAVDTTNLINSLEDHKLSPSTHEVLVNPQKAPYADPLQNNLNRPIMTQADALEWEVTGHAEEIARLQKELGAE